MSDNCHFLARRNMQIDLPQNRLAKNVLEGNSVPGDFSLRSACGKSSRAFLKLVFFSHNLEDSLQTYFGCLNRTVRLADGVYGAVERSEISGKHDQSTDGERTSE